MQKRSILAAACLAVLASSLAPPPAARATSGEKAAEAPQGKLLLRADTAASLVVDGQPAGEVAPGEIRILHLGLGSHRVTVVSRGGETRWEETLDTTSGPLVRLVDLAQNARDVRHEYVRIPAGRFEMGCVERDKQCADDEKPRHPVTLTRDFWMMRTEVTVRAYEAYAKEAGQPMPSPPRFNQEWKWKTYPIVNVTWDQAAAYCDRVGARLPTEAEWEYAARGGHEGWLYVWGNQVKPVVDGYKQANVGDQRGKGAFEVQDGPWFPDYDDGYSRTSPTFQYSANGFGLFDMAGNAWEWCRDWYGAETYPRSPASDPKGPEGGSTRVLRGGAWTIGIHGQRISNREARPPSEIGPDIGFRCVRGVAVP